MVKWIAVVDEVTGKLVAEGNSGLYYFGNDVDAESLVPSEGLVSIELTSEENDEMQQCGIVIRRQGQELYVDSPDEIDFDNDEIVGDAQANSIDLSKAKSKIKDRMGADNKPIRVIRKDRLKEKEKRNQG